MVVTLDRVVFDPQPVLVGANVTLRPLRAEDHDGLYEVARDPLIWVQHPDPDRCRAQRFDEFFADSLRSGGALAIVDSRRVLIGSTRFHGHDPAAGEVEIGWTFLARSHWGGPINREVKHLMLEHAFQAVERVIFLIGPSNRRSQRAVERLGAQQVGHRADGSGRQSVLYEIRRGESQRN
jgi:RimJ/RimL family protein N-acetyltransferase